MSGMSWFSDWLRARRDAVDSGAYAYFQNRDGRSVPGVMVIPSEPLPEDYVPPSAALAPASPNDGDDDVVSVEIDTNAYTYFERPYGGRRFTQSFVDDDLVDPLTDPDVLRAALDDAARTGSYAYFRDADGRTVPGAVVNPEPVVRQCTSEDYEFLEVEQFGRAEPIRIPVRCLHRRTVEVRSIVDGELLGYLCVICDAGPLGVSPWS